jgi:Lrp/AsnC family leucine-responsive transcriptional regulator
MDATDKKILQLLAENAYATTTQIGSIVNLSVPAVNKRIAKLRENGTIRSVTVLTDPKKVGKPILAYVLLVIQYGTSVDKILDYVNQDPDILECQAVTGEYDYIIKICAASVEEFEEKLLYLKKQKGVLKSHTMLCLQEHKCKPTVLPAQEETK